MTNATMKKFGHPGTLIHDYADWVVLLRNHQVTLGSLVVGGTQCRDIIIPYNRSYFVALPRAFSGGYFSSLRAILRRTAASRSTPTLSARRRR